MEGTTPVYFYDANGNKVKSGPENRPELNLTSELFNDGSESKESGTGFPG